MDKRIEAFQTFLNSANSVYHVTAQLVGLLDNAGYTCLRENEEWELIPGGKYYLTRGASALIAFRIPQDAPTGFLFSASHADHPSFKVKENGELTGKYTRLAVEKYGGMLIAPWLDRPLSIAGRVLVETEDGVQSRLVDIDKDLLMIPNVAIHLNRKVNEGYSWNLAVDTLPLLGGENAKGKLDAILQEAAGGKILGHDLHLYVRQKAVVWGVDGEYISAQALDDLACVWGCTQGFLNGKSSCAVPVLCVFDNEEVGSLSAQGADSGLLEGTLGRICGKMGWSMEQLLAQSFMVSADNAQALHPNHPEYADATNAPVVNGGLVVKFNADQKYATDGLSAALFRKLCSGADVPVQTFYNRADMAGGSTLGAIALSHVAVPTADIGLPQLAMHSCFETVGVKDVVYLADAMAAYYGANLQMRADGSYILK